MNESHESPLTKRFLAHPIHDVLDQWRNRIASERPDNLRELNDETRFAYLRLRFVLRHLSHKLEGMNPFLVPYSNLDNIKSHLDRIKPIWEQFRQNPEPHWSQIDNHVEGFVSNLQSLPAAGDSGWTDEFDDLIEQMNGEIARSGKSVDGLMQKADQTDSKYEQVRQNLEGLESELQSQKQRLDEMLTQHTTAFNASEQDRAKRFTDSQDEKKTQFDNLIEEFGSEEEDLISAQKENFAKTHDELKMKTTDLLSKIQEQLDKAVKIVGTIVKTTMSGNYQIIANREYRNAWLMRGVAMVSFAVMGGMIVWGVSALHVDEAKVDWRTVAFRLSLGITFLVPGFYCAKEASRHWSAEKHNRRLALELAALGPFLVSLDETKQKEIIEKKADEYFGNRQRGDVEDELLALRDIHISGDKLLKVVERVAKVVRGGK